MRFDQLSHHLTNTTALRLLPKLPILLDIEETARVDQRALARLLKVSQPAVSRGLTALIGAGAIIREGKGPGCRYRLSREVDWPDVLRPSFHNATSAGETVALRSTPPPRQQEPCHSRPGRPQRPVLRSTASPQPSL